MKRHSIKFIAVLALAIIVVFAACKGKDKTGKAVTPADKEAAFALEPASKRAIHIGYDGGLCQAAIPIAQHKGFFTAEGLTTELTRSGGTQDNARDALAGGKIDTSAGMIAGWLKPITNGIDIRFTVGLHTGCTSAFVLKNSAENGFRKGQTVAFSGGIGGIYHNIAYRFVAHDGFVSDDFKWRDFPADQILLILQNKQADIAVINDQLAEKWVMDGTLRRVRSLHEDPDFKNEACCVMGIAGPFLDQNPVTSEKISRAVYNAAKWIDSSDENKRETAKILLENAYISGTEDYAYQLLKMFRFGIPNDLTEKSLYDSVDEYQRLGVLSKDLKGEDVKKQIWQPLNIEEN